MTTDDVAKVYGTILSIPGMSESFKIDFKMSRKNALLLSSVIERGLASVKSDKSGLLSVAPADSLEELAAFSEDCINKAGLKELSDKLKEFK